MSELHTLTELIYGEAKHDPLTREARLSSAWQAFREGRAGREDHDVIMVDLAFTSGFFHVTPPDAGEGSRAYAEGARSVFARALYLSRPDANRIAAYAEALSAETPHYGAQE